jgi:hypothetical protein
VSIGDLLGARCDCHKVAISLQRQSADRPIGRWYDADTPCRGCPRSLAHCSLQVKQLLATWSVVFVLSQGASFAQDATALRGNSGRDLQSFSVTSLQLVNTNNKAVLATIAPGDTINVAAGTPLSINAVVAGTVGSVQFGYGSTANFQVESGAPYALCGDRGGAFFPCPQLGAGTHTVAATPFSATAATGTKGTTLTRTFTIVMGGSAPVVAPVPAPVSAPVPVPGPTSRGTFPTHSAWLPPVATPVLPATAAHLPDGRVLMWSSKSRTDFGRDGSVTTWTAIYNPATGG